MPARRPIRAAEAASVIHRGVQAAVPLVLLVRGDPLDLFDRHFVHASADVFWPSSAGAILWNQRQPRSDAKAVQVCHQQQNRSVFDEWCKPMKIEVSTETNEEAGSAGYFIATQVCAMLESRPATLEETLRALREFLQGQNRLATGDSTSALALLRGAHARFESVPEARLLLGMTKAHLAAAYLSLQAFDKAVSHAEDCIAIVAGVKRLALTEAQAHMTLASSLGLMGKRDQSGEHYQLAEAILRAHPGTARSLETLESNRKEVLAYASELGSNRPAGTVASIIILAAVVLAALIVLLIWRGL